MRLALLFAALIALLGVPFILQPEDEHDPRRAKSPDQILNIITPHSESIRREFTAAFRRHLRQREGREVFIEWRVPGGTSEIEKVLDTEYAFAFKLHWQRQLGLPWTSAAAQTFNDRRLQPPFTPDDDSTTATPSARRLFLESNVGIGIDLFFGGGAYPFIVNSDKGYLVDSGIGRRRPQWFQDAIIPQEVGGEPFYDPSFRWIGTCVTTFGICVNDDALRRLGVPPTPNPQWTLLADPRLFREVALADPTSSGSVTKAFEMILQQEMRRALAAHPGTSEQAALAQGWETGFQLIQRIAANARYFSNFSAKIPSDVASGDAAAGMCIDYYGRTYQEMLSQPHDPADSRIRFATPEGGSSLSVDPIGMLRGAPNPSLALKFIEFVLSEEGQKLWDFRAGTPGGPERQALRRLPIRRDLYQEPYLAHFADPNEQPYSKSHLFRYEPGWTASAFGAIRFLIKAMCVDPHAELQQAWKALIDHHFPPEALALFQDVRPITYQHALGPIAQALKGSKLEQSRLAQELSEHFRARYRKVIALASSAGPPS